MIEQVKGHTIQNDMHNIQTNWRRIGLQEKATRSGSQITFVFLVEALEVIANFIA